MSPAIAPGARGSSRLRDELRGLVLHSSSALAMRVLRSLGSLVFNLVLARMLGASGTGMYFLALSVTEIAAVVARMGMDATVVRLLAGGRVRGDSLYVRVLALVIAVGMVTTGALLVAAPILCRVLFATPTLTAPLRVMALGIVPWALLFIHGSLLQSSGKIGLSIFIHHVAMFVVGAPLLLILARDGSLVGAALAQVCTTVIVLSLGFALWRRTVHAGFARTGAGVSSQEWRATVRAGASLCLIGLLSAVGTQADIFLLGTLATMGDIGTFRVAFRVAVLSGAALEVVSTAIAPRLAALHAGGNLHALEQTGRAGTALAVLLTLPYWLGILSFPAPVLGLFGAEFVTATTVLILLTAGRIVHTLTGPVSTLLTMAGFEGQLRDLTMVITALRVVSLFVVIPVWGLAGVAIVSASCEIAISIAASVLVYRNLGVVVLPLPGNVLPYRADRAAT